MGDHSINGESKIPQSGSLTLTGQRPALFRLAPDAASLTIAGQAAVIGRQNPTTGVLTLTGAAPRLDLAEKPSGTSLSISGNAPSLCVCQPFRPNSASLSITGQLAGVGNRLFPGSGSLVIAGQVAAIGRFIPASGTLSLSGQPAVVGGLSANVSAIEVAVASVIAAVSRTTSSNPVSPSVPAVDWHTLVTVRAKSHASGLVQAHVARRGIVAVRSIAKTHSSRAARPGIIGKGSLPRTGGFGR